MTDENGKREIAAPPPTLAQEEALLRERLAQAGQRREATIRTATDRHAKLKLSLQEQTEATLKKLERQRSEAQRSAEQDREQRTRRLNERHETEYLAFQHDYAQITAQLNSKFQHERGVAKRELKEASWESQTVFDATKHRPNRELDEAVKQVTVRADRLEAIANDAKEHLQECQMYRAPQIDDEVELPEGVDPLQKFVETQPQAETRLEELKALFLPRLFRSGMPFWLLAILWLGLAYPFGEWNEWHFRFLWQSGLSAIGIDVVISVALYLIAIRQVRALFDPLCQLLMDAEHARSKWYDSAVEKCKREQNAILQKFQHDVHRAKERYEERRTQAIAIRDQASKTADDKYLPQIAQFQKFHAHEAQDLSASYEQRTAETAQQFATLTQQTQQQGEQAQRDADAALRESVKGAELQWERDLQGFDEAAAEIGRRSDLIFPPWEQAAWDLWTPPKAIAPVLRFGEYQLPLTLPDGSNGELHLNDAEPRYAILPAMLEFPDRCSLLIRAAGAGRLRAVDALQAVMLRFLTAVPPGKVRFTIIDPVGLGQNFAGFMHLADYDELLVTHKIWTEPSQIEQRLADLSAHMANVIQKYLRNEFETIDHYNQYAGEVAEPYRVLVVANFPFNFTETATRHLVSIATTGARCGVYTLISIDTKLAVPHGFRVADLEQSCVKLVWREGEFIWRDDEFELFALNVDGPPAPELFSKIVHEVGEAAKDSNRVEVPFEFIAPSPTDWWASSTASGIDVPLGRAGATKRQHMQLGRGTSQHVLVAGKTGSGKSTLLHALITNTALMYSPEELELYLIDFKKGVEFKTYAQYRLPHARVIAIESEREFGLSVLQRLDSELRHRGEMFRDLNVQDLPSYRESTGRPMPRILLVVDEFQEFFVEDDKIAQDVSLLLDRLVRQGRAFGIHIHLGSQTLGGAFSLPRATLGQMAVRVALQCSEADANLILSEENPAARLLTRPGEAIYNDANGRSEGNHLFQVVWLSEERREDYLRKLYDMAVERRMNDRGQIVFEGNVPADLTRNLLLKSAIEIDSWPQRTLAAQAWLGDAIAIKDPTAVTFRAQSGNNVAMIGQQSEAALAMMMAMVVSLAAQHAPGVDEPAENRARLIVADGQAPDALHAGIFNKLLDVVPQSLEVVAPRDLGRVIETIAAEVERRQAIREADLPPIYLLIYDLQRFRDLRKADDDFGFSRDAKPSPAKQFVGILKDGPALGVHVVVWSDSLNNMQRAFDRQTLREFESRILFQMSVTDSSSLIDSPVASKLGPHRALLHSEEEGRLEKFRPYSIPDDAWLKAVATELRKKKSVECKVPSSE